jgi:NADPH-dependent 2,4-dienoyl-CoA reductase/sulfur reductase-like enzyme
LEADVVVIGAGAMGLPAAIAAIDAGASVLVVEANYDITFEDVVPDEEISHACPSH